MARIHYAHWNFNSRYIILFFFVLQLLLLPIDIGEAARWRQKKERRGWVRVRCKGGARVQGGIRSNMRRQTHFNILSIIWWRWSWTECRLKFNLHLVQGTHNVLNVWLHPLSNPTRQITKITLRETRYEIIWLNGNRLSPHSHLPSKMLVAGI